MRCEAARVISLRSFAFVVALAALMLGAIVVHDRVFPKPLLHPRNDFTTFYCAGTVVRGGGDPYRVEPLRACEQRLGEFGAAGDAAWEVVPAPFPGYVLALYALMSLPPPAVAHVAWLGLLLCGVGVTALVAVRLTRFPALPVIVLVALALGWNDINLAEPTPIVAALLACAALAASRGAWRTAGVCTALAMIMPQYALPAWLALLSFAPRTRVPVLIVAAALGVVSFAVLGWEKNLEYFTQTLPAQTAAEVFFPYQYSLTHALALAGVGAPAAILLGQLCYVGLVAIGIVAGVRLWRASGEAAALVLVPPAVASVLGAYSHQVQILMGITAALLIASIRAVPAGLAVAPLLALAVVWTGEGTGKGWVVTTLIGAAAAIWIATTRIAPPRRAVFAAASTAVLLLALTASHLLPAMARASDVASLSPPAIADDAQASRVFGYLFDTLRLADPRRELEKVPLIAGMLILAAASFVARRDGEARAS